MPRIPIPEYERQVGPGGVGVTPRADATPVSSVVGQALGGLGAAIGQGADVVAAYAAKFKADEDRARVDDAYVGQFGPQFRDLYQNYYSLQGKDALDQRPDYEKRMLELRDSVRAGLQNDQQRKLFDTQTRGRVEAELDAMARHAAQQRMVWMAQTHVATLSNYATQAADKYNDDHAFDTAIQSGLQEVDRYGAARGASAETMRAEGSQFVSAAWQSRIERAAVDDPLAAQALYQAHSDLIAPGARPLLERRLQAAVLPVQAKNIADQALAGVAGSSRDVRASAEDAIAAGQAEADKLHPGNPVFADLVTQQIRGHLATIAQAQAAKEQQALEITMRQAIGAPDATGNLTSPKPTTLSQLLANPDAAQAWQTMTPQSQLGVLGLIKQNAHEAENGGASMKTDPRTFEQLWDRMRLPDADPNKLRTWDQLAPFLSHGLSRTDFNFLREQMEQNRTADGQRLDSTRSSFLAAVKGQFDKSTIMSIDAKGGEDFYKFKSYVLQQEAAARRAGKDPYALYDANSPDYVGKKIPVFQRTLAQQQQDFVEQMRRAAAPAPLPPDKQRRPGETVEQYRKRVGLQ